MKDRRCSDRFIYEWHSQCESHNHCEAHRRITVTG